MVHSEKIPIVIMFVVKTINYKVFSRSLPNTLYRTAKNCQCFLEILNFLTYYVSSMNDSGNYMIKGRVDR